MTWFAYIVLPPIIETRLKYHSPPRGAQNGKAHPPSGWQSSADLIVNNYWLKMLLTSAVGGLVVLLSCVLSNVLGSWCFPPAICQVPFNDEDSPKITVGKRIWVSSVTILLEFGRSFKNVGHRSDSEDV